MGGLFSPPLLVCIGTSITLGTQQNTIPITITDILDSYPEKIRVLRGYSRTINAGVSGNTSTQMAARFDQDVLRYSPSAISIEAGTNEPPNGVSVPTFTTNMTTMIQKAKATGARVTVVISPYIVDPTFNSDVEPYREAARGIAASEGVIVLDLYDAMEALSSGDKTAYFPDGVHFSVAGNLWFRDQAALTENADAFTSP